MNTHNLGKALARLLVAALLTTCPLAPALAAQDATPARLSTAWMGEFETFIAWYAKHNGWDKEAGLELTMMPFESGKGIVESLAAYSWDIAGCGAVPALTEPLGDYLTVIAAPTDEAAANAVFVRKNSPVLTLKGVNPAYPDVYGSAETVRGATILCPVGTSAQYLTRSWLQILGLTERDVKLESLQPTQALSAFTGGVGDALSVWAPQTFAAEESGFVPVASGTSCKLSQVILLVANNRFAAEYPERVRAFLRLYLRAEDAIRALPAPELAQAYALFYKEWTGQDATPTMVAADVRQHPLYSLEEQRQLLTEKNGLSPLGIQLRDMLHMYAPDGKLTADQQRRLSLLRITSEFLDEPGK